MNTYARLELRNTPTPDDVWEIKVRIQGGDTFSLGNTQEPPNTNFSSYFTCRFLYALEDNPSKVEEWLSLASEDVLVIECRDSLFSGALIWQDNLSKLPSEIKKKMLVNREHTALAFESRRYFHWIREAIITARIHHQDMEEKQEQKLHPYDLQESCDEHLACMASLREARASWTKQLKKAHA